MDFGVYVALVAVAAMVYSGIARFLQNKLVDRSKMEGVQKESKKLNDEYKKAADRKDTAAMEAVMKKQMELFPQMNKLMLAQFKPMIIIICLFAAFTYAINLFDPSLEDDATLTIYDDGSGCDAAAGDGIYSACVELGGSRNYGKWTVTASALSNGAEIGKNETYFLYNAAEGEDTYAERGTGEPVLVVTDKREYWPGETAKVSVTPGERAQEVRLKVSNGTYFRVDLPFTIPVLNVGRIYQPQWWFIFISVISGLAISFVLSRTVKKK